MPKPKYYFELKTSIDEEWYNLFAVVPKSMDGQPRAIFHAAMGKSVAVLASMAIAKDFGYPFFDKTE